jgi:hypothetical protein
VHDVDYLAIQHSVVHIARELALPWSNGKNVAGVPNLAVCTIDLAEEMKSSATDGAGLTAGLFACR